MNALVVLVIVKMGEKSDNSFPALSTTPASRYDTGDQASSARETGATKRVPEQTSKLMMITRRQIVTWRCRQLRKDKLSNFFLARLWFPTRLLYKDSNALFLLVAALVYMARSQAKTR